MKRISATLPGRVLALLLTLCLLFTAGAVTAFADANEDYPYLYPEEQNYDELSFYVFHLTEEDAEAQEPVNQVAGTYRLLDQEGNVKNWIETDEFKQTADFFRTCYEKGYIPPFNESKVNITIIMINSTTTTHSP